MRIGRALTTTAAVAMLATAAVTSTGSYAASGTPTPSPEIAPSPPPSAHSSPPSPASSLAPAGTPHFSSPPARSAPTRVQQRRTRIDRLEFNDLDRVQALAHWTPDRMKAAGRGTGLGPTGPGSRAWTGDGLATVGRLFFQNHEGVDTFCSATAVRSRNKSVVMTAAHCIRRSDMIHDAYSRMVFVPGYTQGATPHGTFAVNTAYTARSWREDAAEDIAALTVDEQAGRRLTDVVGGHDISFDSTAPMRITAFGYPASNPDAGEVLRYCSGTTRSLHTDPPELAIGCDMTGGASGGPWFRDFDPARGTGTLVSVNSHGDALTGSTIMAGPVLGTTARELYNTAQAQRFADASRGSGRQSSPAAPIPPTSATDGTPSTSQPQLAESGAELIWSLPIATALLAFGALISWTVRRHARRPRN
ncbi:trypsin-like peptidase domain-containing protein [Streptomyces sp. TRM66268-LWL]|uniref:Trypsin-like peptidase domain-containing protein n=1 Tax=Streptomyces polyasparticus TaxID=2767826 RepID=A0ABR7SVF4_9ACTN|nr:trypsin-like peptidase domain-containing protein [Streptomyces polyasparticus]MBC9719494.1 trypsin-like peptidase domain-containing protein [Streptomyces polyasparticus]